MQLVLALALALAADVPEEVCTRPEVAHAIDGGCAVRPGVGSLVSVAMVFGALLVARRRAKEPQDR